MRVVLVSRFGVRGRVLVRSRSLRGAAGSIGVLLVRALGLRGTDGLRVVTWGAGVRGCAVVATITT